MCYVYFGGTKEELPGEMKVLELLLKPLKVIILASLSSFGERQNHGTCLLAYKTAA